jgi:prepilin-type N-terminal cleavage/methylation domain-containing protein
MKTVKNKLMGKNGFTLLEVMIALSILAVGLLSLEGMFVTSMGATSRGGRETQAVQLAQQKIEEFKTTKYDTIVSGGDGVKIDSLGKNVADLPANGLPKIYTRTWTVVADANAQLKTVTVTVAWNATTSSDKGHQISLVYKLYNAT